MAVVSAEGNRGALRGVVGYRGLLRGYGDAWSITQGMGLCNMPVEGYRGVLRGNHGKTECIVVR